MTSPCLLGIDLGTSSVKLALIDHEGQLLAETSQSYSIETPYPGWAEQSPKRWIGAVKSAFQRLLENADITPNQLSALGLSGQSHGLVCVDGSGRVLRPAIIWADQRSVEQVAVVKSTVGLENLARWTGNPLATGFQLSSWLWLRENEPEIAAQTRKLLLPKDYVRYWLTGVLGSEPSDAGSTSMFDPINRRWSSELLASLDIDDSLLPPVSASAEVAGGLSREVAAELGIPAGTPVVFGGADQACQALANGVLAPGVVSCTIGTGGQLLAPTPIPAVDSELRLHFYNHIAPDLWWSMGAILSAGLSLTWLRDNVLHDVTYQDIAELAASAPVGCEGLYFLPYLAGERTPHMDANARGGFIGLTLRHDRKHLSRAVMEGVVFALRQALDLMLELGVPVEIIVASGGGTKHPLWLQLQADIFERPIRLTKTTEAAAIGAALLAGIGIGEFVDAQDAVSRTVQWSDTVIEPIASHVTYYQHAYHHFCQLYPALKTTDFEPLISG